MKNITLGYTFPSKLIKKFGLSLLDPETTRPDWTRAARVIADPPRKVLGKEGRTG